MNDQIDVSFVVTVFNKAPFLAATIRSLAAQSGGLRPEYVFVDDASTDGSVDVIREETRDLPNTRIITNARNLGPSIRLNQGARQARGRLLHFIDGDDVLPDSATRVMADCIDRENADVVYGGEKMYAAHADSEASASALRQAGHVVADDPLMFAMRNRVSGIALMTTNRVFERSGGCDEQVFIQDISLPIRLGAVSKRWVRLNGPVVLVNDHDPRRLSHNKAQVFHDWVLSYHRSIGYLGADAERLKPLIYRRCMSFAWKYVRHTEVAPAFSRQFVRYLRSRLDRGRFVESDIKDALERFAGDTTIRRM